MPNWCFNSVSITGDEKGLKAFKKLVKGQVHEDDNGPQDFCFDRVVPMPDDIKKTTSPNNVFDTQAEVDAFYERIKKDDFPMKRYAHTQAQVDEMEKKHGATNWYDWCIKNWGVKWDASSPELTEFSHKLEYQFETPWGPPEEIFEALKERFPNLDISWYYNEPGMEFDGFL